MMGVLVRSNTSGHKIHSGLVQTTGKVYSDKNTAPSQEYEKTKTRKFLPKWQVGRPWLQNDWASEN